MEENMDNYFWKNFRCVVKYLGLSFISSLVLLFLLSLLLCYTNVSEKMINTGVIIITVFSVLLGSFLLGKKQRVNGFMYGGVIGTSYIVIIYMLSSLINGDFSIRYRSCYYASFKCCIWYNWRDIWSKYKKLKIFEKYVDIFMLLIYNLQG